jgi:hypothetical protein
MESWSLFSLLKNFAPISWLYVGDFNKIMHQYEKLGACRRRERQMEDFCNALDDYYLGDMGFTGPCFTWSNKRHDGTYTQERLDRALANSGWCDMYKSAGVEVMAARASIHHPLLISFNTHQSRRLRGDDVSNLKQAGFWTMSMGQLFKKHRRVMLMVQLLYRQFGGNWNSANPNFNGGAGRSLVRMNV